MRIAEEEFQEADITSSNRVKTSKKNQLTLPDTAKMEARRGFLFEILFLKSSLRSLTNYATLQLKLFSEMSCFTIAEKIFREADVPLASILDKVKLNQFDQYITAAVWNQLICSNEVGQGRFGSVYKVTLISNDSFYFSPSTFGTSD